MSYRLGRQKYKIIIDMELFDATKEPGPFKVSVKL